MSNTPSDEELIAELEAAGVAFMAFRGGIGGTTDIWTTYGSQDARKIAEGIRAVLARWGTPQPVVREPLPPASPCAMTESEYRLFKLGWLEAEAAHGIKGGQHGTE